MSDGQVQIKFASIDESRGDGHVLTLKTVDGPDVKFLLDDVALAMLVFTGTYVAKALHAQIGDDTSKVRMFGKDSA